MTTLHITGMHCGACVRRVSAALGAVPGTRVDQVEVGQARVDSSAPEAALLAAVEKAGFSAVAEHP